ncbi:sulfatase-like hydrolase/transferase [Nocardioides sp.]|uniref:sulfatase-like hydrolase/transferase n=1 Tax=Nocardioides sp. TaxID=35761 RepID=UPI002ED4653C
MRMRAGIVATVSGVLLTSGCVATADVGKERPERPRVVQGDRIARAEPEQRAPGRPERPSFVVVLMDDFSLDLLPAMRQAQVMARAGASYEHAYVVDSLCCVSRSSLFTGQYPHQTGVRTNTANTPNLVGPLGGFEAFEAYGNPQRSVNVQLQQAGWTTGLIGKFLNEYYLGDGVELPPVPPGWSSWQPVFPDAYDGWDFHTMRTDADGDAVVEHVAAPPAEATRVEKDAAYAGTVIADRAVEFVRQNERRDSPYFLMVTPFGPHSRVRPEGHYPGDPGFPPAFADRPGPRTAGNCGPVACGDLDASTLPGFADDQTDNAPVRADGSLAAQWRPATVASPDPDVATSTLRQRAQMVQSIDRMVARIRAAVGPDTFVVLTSDNGFHLGRYGLGQGKGSPFEADVRVPLIITGPGVVPGARAEVVSNLDLAPTLERLAGLAPPAYRAGTSLVPTFDDPGRSRRDHTFFEHTWSKSLGPDPDASFAGGSIDSIPSYVAVRSRRALLVRFDLDPTWEGVDHAYELYDYGSVGWERRNAYGDPRQQSRVARLTELLDRFTACQEITLDQPVPRRCRELTR